MALVDEFGSSQVTVNKVELIDTMKKNRETHLKEWQDATAGFKEKLVERLTEMLDRAKGNIFETNTDLDVPNHHLKDFDRVIKMLEMSTAPEIKISESQFRQYVMDEWSWKHDFEMHKALYTSKVRR